MAIQLCHLDVQNAVAALGGAMRARREHSGVSLRACAKKMGISSAYLCDVELGRRAISRGLLDKFIEETGD
jgi:transcriptional regulator with XRE-family HTH domain